MRSNGTAPMQPASSACSTPSENRCQQSEFRASAPLSSLGPMAPLMVSRVRDISSHNEKHAGNKGGQPGASQIEPTPSFDLTCPYNGDPAGIGVVGRRRDFALMIE